MGLRMAVTRDVVEMIRDTDWDTGIEFFSAHPRQEPWNGPRPAALPEGRGSEQKVTNAPGMQTLYIYSDYHKFFTLTFMLSFK
jgi:hypothetical protein